MTLSKRLLIALTLSVVVTIVLVIGAAMYGGMCHCSTAMFTLFPFGAFVMMKTSWESSGLLLALVQFPLYALIVTVVNGTRMRVIVLLLIVALHILGASFALHDYCQSRHRCELAYPQSLAEAQNQA
jgi:hypothetical protein